MQVVGFVAMLVIFYAVVACPTTDNPEGICQYKQQLTLTGAMVMLSLIGIRYGQKNKKKRKAE